VRRSCDDSHGRCDGHRCGLAQFLCKTARTCSGSFKRLRCAPVEAASQTAPRPVSWHGGVLCLGAARADPRSQTSGKMVPPASCKHKGVTDSCQRGMTRKSAGDGQTALCVDESPLASTRAAIHHVTMEFPSQRSVTIYRVTTVTRLMNMGSRKKHESNRQASPDLKSDTCTMMGGSVSTIP
jgi:hypothetical protein